MDKPLSVLLIEDEQVECTAFINYIDSLDDIRLIGVTRNSDKALEYARDCLPDAIILDLELHKGGGNGLSFLMKLEKSKSQKPPYILVTTNNVSPVTHNQARHLGADFIMLKSQADYSAESVIEFLRSLSGVIRDAQKKRPVSDESGDESPVSARKRLSRQVTTEIDLIGISPKALGRKYLIDAIVLRVENDSHSQISVIAQKYGKTNGSVERAMQNAIDRAWRTNDIEELQRYYTARINSEKGIPTLTEFILYYANKLKLNIE